MDVLNKVRILANAAKFDVSCSSSGSDRKNTKGGVGNASASGICHSWSADGRCISLLKILMSNVCAYDCIYCVNRATNDIERATLTPEEVAEITINFYRRNYIEGLFLSSAVIINPDHTMELMIKALKSLREVYQFNGYIHVKVIPGADSRLVAAIGLLADRVSVNIELPSNDSLKMLAPQKTKEDIIKPMKFITGSIEESRSRSLVVKNQHRFVPAGQTTQLMVGASPERDVSILRLSENLYRSFRLKRVYYSSYIPMVSHRSLPSIVTAPPLMREHRLYQADWLLRFYGFTASEILNDKNPDLSMDFDPKTGWAMQNLHLFPMEINRVDYEMLIRIPGIGVRSAKRIMSARRVGSVDYELLKKIGVVLKRAMYFITCKGKYYGEVEISEENIRHRLLADNHKGKTSAVGEQLSLFSVGRPEISSSTSGTLYIPGAQDVTSALTGEL